MTPSPSPMSGHITRITVIFLAHPKSRLRYEICNWRVTISLCEVEFGKVEPTWDWFIYSLGHHLKKLFYVPWSGTGGMLDWLSVREVPLTPGKVLTARIQLRQLGQKLSHDTRALVQRQVLTNTNHNWSIYCDKMAEN